MAQIRLIGSTCLAVCLAGGLSGYVLAITPSDHIHLATLATGFSLAAAIVEKRIFWNNAQRRLRLRKLLRDGKYEATLTALEHDLDTKNPSQFSLDCAAIAYGKLGRHDKLISARERALGISRTSLNLNSTAAAAYFMARRYQEGYALIEEAIRRDESLVLSRINQCLFLIELDRTGEARHAWLELKQSNRAQLRLRSQSENSQEVIQKIRARLSDADEL